MKWFRKSVLWASVGYFGSTCYGQEANWRAADPRPASAVVSLGTPTPLANNAQAGQIRVVSAFVPIQQGPAPSVVRAASARLDDEPNGLFLPRGLPPLPQPDAPNGLFLPRDLPVLPPLDAPHREGDSETRLVPVVQPPPKDKAKIIELDKDGKSTVAPGPAAAVSPPTPACTGEGRVICGGPLGADESVISSIFGFHFDGNQRFYARGEALLWWTRGFNLPALVTTSPATAAMPGVLGQSTTQLLYGDSTTSSGPSPGARFTFGYTLDPCGWCTLEGSFFFLGRKNDDAFFSSSNFPVLARPFTNLNLGMPGAELATTPLGALGVAGTGSIRVDTSSTLLGAEANVRSLLWCGCNFQVTGLVGFRYLDLSDNLGITENTLVTVPAAVFPGSPDVAVKPGSTVTVFDRFDTHNQFYGGQVGASAEWQFGRWTLEGLFKLGIGVTQQSVDIEGGQHIVPPTGPAQNFVGGLYALPSNIGQHTQSRFGFVPEIGINLHYQLTDHIKILAGYDFLYWSSVLRPGDQIDQVLDVNQVPQSGRPFPAATQVRPLVPLQTSSYWAQGFNVGLEFRY